MRKNILVLLLFFYASVSYAFPTAATDSILNELGQVIKNRETYTEKKQARIQQLKQNLQESAEMPLQQQFKIYSDLYSEYQAFKYDSAFAYALKLQETARRLDDPVKATYAKLKLTFTLLSSGMYKETFDSLHTVSLANMPDSIKVAYYVLNSRTYYDLGAYNKDIYYTRRYAENGDAYTDSALTLVSKNTLQFYNLRGIKRLNEGKLEAARSDFEHILYNFTPSPSFHDYAMAAALLANIYERLGETDKAIAMMAQAAIADIKSSTRETTAMMYLAELLYNNGDESRAYTYIKQAQDDATFYGARQRKIYVSAILPIIEGERLVTVENQRSRLFTYSIVVTLLSVLVLAFVVIIFRQLKQLREAKRTVTEANNNLHEINKSLVEANRIKEEYIGYSFGMYSGYIDKMEKFKKSLDNKLRAKKVDELGQVMKSINLKKEREDLYLSFDRIFLKLFPSFVPTFNSLFKEEDRVVLKDKDSLNIEMRIFALIRIGIHDHEQIASMLEYSVSTIYNYKTKVKNRSIVPNDEFEKRIMEIKAF